MSVDTYIYVDKKTYEVWMCTASCLTDLKKRNDIQKQKLYLLGKGESLKSAIRMAENHDDYRCEYGISFRLWCK